MSFLEDEEARLRAQRKRKIAAIKAKQRTAEMKSPVAKFIRTGRLTEAGDPAVGKPVVGR